MAYRPLADEIRPDSLDDVVGQKHILGEGGTPAPHHRERQDPQPGLLRPIGYRQDHGGQHHRPPFRPGPAADQRHHRVPSPTSRT